MPRHDSNLHASEGHYDEHYPVGSESLNDKACAAPLLGKPNNTPLANEVSKKIDPIGNLPHRDDIVRDLETWRQARLGDIIVAIGENIHTKREEARAEGRRPPTVFFIEWLTSQLDDVVIAQLDKLFTGLSWEFTWNPNGNGTSGTFTVR